MVGKKTIKIKMNTLELLQILKVRTGKVSYDDVLNEIMLKYEMNVKAEKLSNEDLQLFINSNYKQMLKRLEALHDRFGYYEKNYFTKIIDIADDIADGVLPNRIEEVVKSEVISANDKVGIEDESILQKRYSELESAYEELRMTSKNNTGKIRTLKSKISKKGGVFSSGYDLNLTEEEYKSIFN